ncbi:MAG: hypothetical protein ACJ72N_14195 [Labedaea sp.]
MANSVRTRLAVVGVAAMAAAALAAVPASASGTGVQASYCKRVTAREISVFAGASSDVAHDHWGTGIVFYVDRTDPPYNRYHVVSGPNWGWTTSDPAYVTNCNF